MKSIPQSAAAKDKAFRHLQVKISSEAFVQIKAAAAARGNGGASKVIEDLAYKHLPKVGSVAEGKVA